MSKDVMHPWIEKIIISSSELDKGISDAACWINKRYQNKNLVLISILKGSVPFFGTLVPRITVDLTMDFMSISSFKGGVSAVSLPELVQNISVDIVDKDVLLIEDIVDSGRTISLVMDLLKKQNPKSLSILTLIDKPEGRTVDLKVDYACFEIPLLFIVGFGLDYKELLRNIPYIGTLKEEIYANDGFIKGDNNEN